MNTQTLVRARLRGHLPAAKAPPLFFLVFLLRTEQGRSTVAAKFPFCFHLSPSIFQRDLVRPEQLGHLQAELPPCWPGLLPLGSILTTPPAPSPTPCHTSLPVLPLPILIALGPVQAIPSFSGSGSQHKNQWTRAVPPKVLTMW